MEANGLEVNVGKTKVTTGGCLSAIEELAHICVRCINEGLEDNSIRCISCSN